MERIEQALERLGVPGHELEHPQLVLGPAGGERRRMPERKRDETAVATDEAGVADPELLGERELELKQFPDPSPGPGEVVIEMKASGMCGSDLHAYRAARAGA